LGYYSSAQINTDGFIGGLSFRAFKLSFSTPYLLYFRLVIDFFRVEDTTNSDWNRRTYLDVFFVDSDIFHISLFPTISTVIEI
jgi:hypothetical protein